MKRILAALALMACVGLAFMPADADRIFDTQVGLLTDPSPGFAGVVCSTWNNDSDPNGGYVAFNPGTGKYFHLVQVYADSTDTAQQFTIRFWESSTDSTSIYNGAITVDVGAGQCGLLCSYPIQCAKVTFTSVGTSDDITAIGYLKTTAGPTVAAD